MSKRIADCVTAIHYLVVPQQINKIKMDASCFVAFCFLIHVNFVDDDT